MAEYSGYISVNPVDWGKVARDAGQEVIDVLKNRRDERVKLDDLNNNLQSEIASYEATKSPEANEFIMAGSQSARAFIQSQNDLLKSGQITPEQYKRNIQNTQVGFKGFKVVMDNFSKNIEESRKLMESGVTGKQADWVNDVNGKMFTLKNKLMTVGTNGNLYIKDVDSGDLYDVQSLTNQENRVVKKVQLIPEVDNAVKGLGVGAKYDSASGKYVLSPKVLGDWNKTKEDVANAILSSDSRIASVLADNLTGYSFTDKKERGENEILMERDANRVWSPVLTEEQKQKAREIVMSQIEERVSYKEKDDSLTAYQKAMLQESRAKRKLAEDNLALKKKQYKQKTGKEMEPLLQRKITIESLAKKGNRSEYAGMLIGNVLPYMQGIGEKASEGDVGQAYEGFVVTAIRPAPDGKIDVVVKRKEEGKKEEIQTIRYTKSDFDSDVNTLLNKTEGTKIGTEKLINYDLEEDADYLFSSTEDGQTQQAEGDLIF